MTTVPCQFKNCHGGMLDHTNPDGVPYTSPCPWCTEHGTGDTWPKINDPIPLDALATRRALATARAELARPTGNDAA